MPQYTTGTIAKLCNISVRTVQFYDQKGLLTPTALTEGGRRLYSDEDLKQLNLICLLKALGLSLDSIKGILESAHPEKILVLLLDEQEKELANEIQNRQTQLQVLQMVKQSIQATHAVPVQTIRDIEHMMKSKKKLRTIHGTMLAVGILMDAILIFTILHWITKGSFWPFVCGFPIVCLLGWLMVKLYHKNTAYLCAQCSKVFQPSLSALFFSKHTPKTRKLTCPDCGHTGYCVETIQQQSGKDQPQ